MSTVMGVMRNKLAPLKSLRKKLHMAGTPKAPPRKIVAKKPDVDKFKKMAILLEENNELQINKIRHRDSQEGMNRLQVLFPQTPLEEIQQVMLVRLLIYTCFFPPLCTRIYTVF